MARTKKEMNAFDLMCIERELQVLVGGYLEKSYQPSRDEVLLRCRVPGEGRHDIIIGLGRYIFRTERPRDNPVQPPQFTAMLRKHLNGARITGLRQHAFDRILVMTLEKAGETYELVAECFHNGNVVLVKDGTIVQPLVHRSWAHREVRPGRDWVFPPAPFDPKEAAEPAFMQRLRESDRELIRTLAARASLGPVYAEEVCLRAEVDKGAMPVELDAAVLSKVVRTARELVAEVRDRPQPRVVLDDEGEPVDASPIELRVHEGRTTEATPTLSTALDRLFVPDAGRTSAEEQHLERIEQERARLTRQRDDIQRRSSGFAEAEAKARTAGDLIYAHFQGVEQVLTEAEALRASAGWKQLTEEGLAVGDVRIARTRPETGEIVVAMPDADGTSHEVALSLGKSVGANAEVHYERAKQMKEKAAGAQATLDETNRQLDRLGRKGSSLEARIEAGAATPGPTKPLWFERFRWFISSSGNLVLAGRDARTNMRLVKKQLKDRDRYMHADIHGAPSLVIKADEDGHVPEDALEEAAQFAVAFSKAWTSGLGRGEAYWVTPPQVSRTAQAGEFVPKGGFIIRGERTYIRAETRCAIGETTVENTRKVMGGPVTAVENRCDRFIELEPGRVEPGKLASVLSRLFEVPVEEVQRVLPPGGASIVRSKGINEELLAEVRS